MSRARRLALPLGLAGIAVLHCWPVIASGDRWGFWDWDVFETLAEAGRRSVWVYGELPGWNPWLKGGEPLDSHPLQMLASPAFLAVLAFGTVPAFKLWVVLRSFAALYGGALLGRRLGFTTPGAVTLALLFGLASTYALRVGHGHWNLQAVAYLPLLIYAGLGAAEPRAWRDRAFASLWLALLFLEGGPYAYAMGVLGLGTLVAVELARRRVRAVAALMAVLALSLGLSAVKLLPTLAAYGGGLRDNVYAEQRDPEQGRRVFHDFYRPDFRASAGQILHQALLERNQAGGPDDAHRPFAINVGAYLGWGGLAWVACGALLGGGVARVALLLALPFLWLALGSAAPVNLWALLHPLPLWSSMTIPSKFTACYLLGFAVAAGAGSDALARRARSRGARLALAAAIALPALDQLAVARPIFAYAFPIEPIAVQAGRFHQVATSPFAAALRERVQHSDALPRRPRRASHALSTSFPALQANLGVLGTYSGQPLPRFAEPDRGEQLDVEQQPAGPAPRLLAWSPNRIELQTRPEAGVVVVNQNFHPGWRATSQGQPLPVAALRGRLSARIPAGTTRVDFQYRSDPTRLGGALSALSLAGLLGLLWLGRAADRRRSARSGLIVLLCLPALAGCGASPASRPDLVVITLDTTRADHLGVYGYPRPVSPRLDALARESVVYERAWSTASWTLPAHASLFTGKYPTSHGAHFDEQSGSLSVQGELARRRGAAFRVNPLDESETTLAELARDAGYATAAFVGGPWLVPEFGVVQGFAHVDARAQGRAGVRGDELTQRAETWLAQLPRSQPSLLFVNYFDPHAPYDPPEAFRRLVAAPADAAARNESLRTRRHRELLERYDGEIRFMDQQLGRLLDALKQHGRYSGALIVVTADHGELFGEHGQLGHRRWLYEELMRVPLLIRYPGGRDGGTRSQDALSLVDLLPLVAGVGGFALPPGVEGVAPGARQLVLGECFRDALSIASDPTLDRDLFAAIRWPWKLLLNDRGETSLYRLDQDPREQHDQRGAAEEATLREQLTAMRAALRPPLRSPRETRSPSDDAVRRLRALGYLE